MHKQVSGPNTSTKITRSHMLADKDLVIVISTANYAWNSNLNEDIFHL